MLLRIGGTLMAVYSAFVVLIIWLAKLMFEYSLYTITGKDVVWYLDLLGAFAFNVVNFPVFVACVIARACGVEVPFIGE